MTLELQTFLPYRLSHLTNRISRQLADEYSVKFNINIHQWRVIAVLGQSPGLTASKIAVITAMDKVAVTRAVQDLVKRSILYREASAQDGRLSLLHLANSGKTIYRNIKPVALWYENFLLNSLSQQERETLEQVFTNLENSMTQLEKTAKGISAAMQKDLTERKGDTKKQTL